jgi:type IV secretory pathway VirJ component
LPDDPRHRVLEGGKGAICPSLSPTRVTSQQVGSGHHFGGNYAELADKILAFAKSARPMT